MSKIVSPYPPLVDGDVHFTPPAQACWWRLRLVPNGDGNLLILRTDARGVDMATATWCSWEFFDGEDVVIDTGFDRPTKARIIERDCDRLQWPHRRTSLTTFIDVLHEGPPSPSPQWRQLTRAGVWAHPDDYSAGKSSGGGR